MMKWEICTECGGYGFVRTEHIAKVRDRYVPQTNADRIRAMSDEELAEFLADEISHGDCYGCDLDCATYECDKFMDSCYNAHYRWLKQPAEVDNG